MRNSAFWQPSKYVISNGRLTASRDPAHVGIGSRLICDLTAKHFDQNLKQHAKGTLLDLGCGNVPLYASYKQLASNITCADWNNSIHRNHYLDLECDLTQGLPFQDKSFHTVILSDVLEHIPEPESICREIARILAPNGKVLVSVPFFYCLHEMPYDYFRYTKFALMRFISSSGLSLIKLEEIGGAPEILTDIFAKTALEVPVIGSAISKTAQWLTSRFIETKIGHKISRATSESFPLGYFFVAQKL